MEILKFFLILSVPTSYLLGLGAILYGAYRTFHCKEDDTGEDEE